MRSDPNSGPLIVLVAVIGLAVLTIGVFVLDAVAISHNNSVPDWAVGVALLSVRELGDVVSRYVQQQAVTVVQRQAMNHVQGPAA